MNDRRAVVMLPVVVCFLVSVVLLNSGVVSGFFTLPNNNNNNKPKYVSRYESAYSLNERHAKNTTPTITGDDESPTVIKSKVSIAIIGSGAVGCYYGARLWETGRYNVTFHMRGEHLVVSKREGLTVESIEGNIYIPPEDLQAYEDVHDIGTVDWVILCLKSTSIGATRSLLEPLLTQKSRVLTIMNGMVDEDIVKILEGNETTNFEPNIFPYVNTDATDRSSSVTKQSKQQPLTKCSATYGGMALLCSNRIGPGHIQHSYAGKLTASLAASSSNDAQTIADHEQAMKDLWQPTQGFEFCYDDNLVRARWSKSLWNLPFNGISVAMGGITIDRIVQDEGLRSLAYIVMDETIAIANKDLQSRGYSSEHYLGDVEVSNELT